MKLNKIEKIKLKQSAKGFYEKLDSLSSKNLSDADIFFLRNFGIYTTKQNIDSFMLRIRVPAGRIKKDRLKTILDVSKNKRLLLTARAEMEIHDLNFKEAIDTHKYLLKNGISTFATLSDNVRNIVTDPFDGLDGSKFEAFTLIQKMDEIATDIKNLASLPRKFNVAISANSYKFISFFNNDCYFALAKKDDAYGFKLFLGGKNSSFAKDSNLFVRWDRVVDIYEAILRAYSKYGLKESRNRARLYYLIEEIGMEGFLERVKEFYKKDFEYDAKLVVKNTPLDNLSFEAIDTDFAEVDKKLLEELLNKEGEIRLGADHRIYLINKSKNLKKEFSSMVVCAGSRYCVFSLFDTKERAKEISNLLSNLNVGYSGCLKGCARHTASDIGFVGIRTNAFNVVERGVRLFLGGEYTEGKRVARQIYWAVPLRKLHLILKSIIDDFRKSGFKEFEEYSKNILNSFSTPFLGYFFLAKVYTKKDISLKDVKEEIDIFGLGYSSFEEAVKELEQKLYCDDCEV
jgi:ferredoxin-nitrite reductase